MRSDNRMLWNRDGNGFIITSVCALLDTKFDALALLEIFAVVKGTKYVNDHVLMEM